MSGLSLSERGSKNISSMGMLLVGCGRGLFAPFSSSFRRPHPTRGAGGPVQLRPSIPARLDKRGSFSPAQDDGPGSRRTQLSASVGGAHALRPVRLPFSCCSFLVERPLHSLAWAASMPLTLPGNGCRPCPATTRLRFRRAADTCPKVHPRRRTHRPVRRATRGPPCCSAGAAKQREASYQVSASPALSSRNSARHVCSPSSAASASRR